MACTPTHAELRCLAIVRSWRVWENQRQWRQNWGQPSQPTRHLRRVNGQGSGWVRRVNVICSLGQGERARRERASSSFEQHLRTCTRRNPTVRPRGPAGLGAGGVPRSRQPHTKLEPACRKPIKPRLTSSLHRPPPRLVLSSCVYAFASISLSLSPRSFPPTFTSLAAPDARPAVHHPHHGPIPAANL